MTFYYKFPRRKKISSGFYRYNFKLFPLKSLLLKNLFLPKNSYTHTSLMSLHSYQYKIERKGSQYYTNPVRWPSSLVRSHFERTLKVQWKSPGRQNIQPPHLPKWIVSSGDERSLTRVWFYSTRTIYYTCYKSFAPRAMVGMDRLRQQILKVIDSSERLVLHSALSK